MLGARNSSPIDEFFTIGRHEGLDVYYISHSYFGLTRQSVRNNSDMKNVFKQTLGDNENMHKDISGNGIAHCELKEMCRIAWSEKFN